MLDVKEGRNATAPKEGMPKRSEDLSNLVEEILRQSDVAIRAGASLPFADGVLTAVKAKLRPEVTKHLGERNLETAAVLWEEDSVNALKAATILGGVATSIARLRREDKIDSKVMDKAFALVQEECNGQFGPDGCWCGC
jgi:hypothetical protein